MQKIWTFLESKEYIVWSLRSRLLGHIIFEEDIRIDPKIIDDILQINHSININELQYFIGKINFLRRFIPNLAELLRNITNMLKKEEGVKWTLEAKNSFELVKQIGRAHV